MTPESFLNGRVRLFCGDMAEALKELPDNSVDSCVCDPPYHLSSIMRSSSGFMGKKWDGGDVSFRISTWRAVYRVLKPGGHLVAFSGTRTYHRMACAIEDANFEIRDQLAWMYGSGFPKSHDVSKGIDSRGGKQIGWFGPWLKRWRQDNGVKQNEIAVLFPSKTGGKTGCVANWELGLGLPTPEQFNLICERFGLPFESLDAAEREIIGQRTTGIGTGGGTVAIMGDGSRDLTRPATEEARQWEGWGTALKPAWEPIVLARKPLSEKTVAANVLKWGVGALNVDGCRNGGAYAQAPTARGQMRGADAGNSWKRGEAGEYQQPVGRWPANIVHDGSDEVVAGFPDGAGQQGDVRGTEPSSPMGGVTFGRMDLRVPAAARNDTGSAARFFYTAKADADDRLGSKHPTVKPVDLMQWLVRLVTPKNGTCLDPFAGTGTTAEAAFREGMSAVLVEREEEYQADIRRRMALVLAGPDERAREALKASGRANGHDDLPLFADEYDAQKDLGASIDLGFRTIRERVAAGGPSWQRSTDDSDPQPVSVR